MIEQNDGKCELTKNGPCGHCDGLMWWAMLIVAVLAIPSIAVVIAMMLPFGDLGRAITFVVTCWVSTWIGMWLMNKSNKANPPAPPTE